MATGSLSPAPPQPVFVLVFGLGWAISSSPSHREISGIRGLEERPASLLASGTQRRRHSRQVEVGEPALGRQPPAGALGRNEMSRPARSPPWPLGLDDSWVSRDRAGGDPLIVRCAVGMWACPLGPPALGTSQRGGAGAESYPGGSARQHPGPLGCLSAGQLVPEPVSFLANGSDGDLLYL